MSMLRLLVVIAVLGVSISAFAQVPVVGAPGSLKGLAGSGKLVTVVIKETDSLDRNLQIDEIYSDYFSAKTQSGERVVYPFKQVKEIRVQDAAIEVKKVRPSASQGLRAAEQEVVDRAMVRVKELFSSANDNQSIKIKTASLMTVSNDPDGRAYLSGLATGNNLAVALDAVQGLYLAGDTEDWTPLVDKGFESGERKVRMNAMVLAGFLGCTKTIPLLVQLSGDRSADICTPAMRSLARMKNREALKTMLDALVALDEMKGEAAVFALSRLGGPEVLDFLKKNLESNTGTVWYRMVRILYALNDPLGRDMLKNSAMQIVTLRPKAALILAKEGDADAMQFLRTDINARKDPTEENLIYRAQSAASLIKGGDDTPKTVLQELMRLDPNAVYTTERVRAAEVKAESARKVKIEVCKLIGELGDKRLLTLLQPGIESNDPEVAVSACESALALAKEDFRKRLIDYRE